MSKYDEFVADPERKKLFQEEYIKVADGEIAALREELEAARAVIESQKCYCSSRDWRPACPDCSGVLRRVRYPGGYLNEEQFYAVRAALSGYRTHPFAYFRKRGDWYCTNCKGEESNTGYRYWWDWEIKGEPQIQR